MASAVTAVQDKQEKVIDREKTCPLLLRVFLSKGRPHQLSEYGRGNLPPNELQIYTWQDATLEELSGLVKEVNPDARKKGTTFEFRLVYPDVRGPAFRFRDIGSTTTGIKGPDDAKTLASVRFVIGDYLDVHVVLPASRIGSGPERDHRRDHRMSDHPGGYGMGGGGRPDRRDNLIDRRGGGDRDRDVDRRDYQSNYDRRRDRM
jgi:histone deacetylase complex subunit SAP18